MLEFFQCVAGHEDFGGDQLPRFSSRDAVEHFCVVSFNKQSLNLHRSDRERHGLLGLKDLNTAMSHGGNVESRSKVK